MIEESYIMKVDVEPPVFRYSDGSTSDVSLSRSGLPRLTVDHQILVSNVVCLVVLLLDWYEIALIP